MSRAGTLFLLFAGLLTGWLVGHGAETVAGVSRAPRTVTVVERVEVRVLEPGQPSPAAQRIPVVRPTPDRLRDAPPVQPVAALEPGLLDPGLGLVEFDGRCGDEICEAEIPYVDLWGDECEEEGETVSEGVQHFALVPGEYDLVWNHAHMEPRRFARVRVGAGHVTRVAASEPFRREQFWISPGQGSADLRVLDLAGEPVGADYLYIGRPDPFGDWEELELATEEDGRVWTELHPGEYVLRIGDHRVRVFVEANRTTEVTVRPGWQGELRFDREPEGTVTLERLPMGSTTEPHCESLDELRFLFLQPGRYRVMHQLGIESGWRPMGDIDVRAREAVTFQLPALPQGEVVVGLYTTNSPSSFEATLEADPLDGQPGAVSVFRHIKTRGMGMPFAAKLPALHPGRWRVRASVGGFYPAERVVEVGDESGRVNFSLEPVR